MKEAIEYLHIGRTKMYMLMHSGCIQGYKVGNTWRFYLRDLRALVSGGNVEIGTKAATNRVEQGQE